MLTGPKISPEKIKILQISIYTSITLLFFEVSRLIYNYCSFHQYNSYLPIAYFISFLLLLVLTTATMILAYAQGKIIYSKNIIYVVLALFTLIMLVHYPTLIQEIKSSDTLRLQQPVGLNTKLILFIVYLLILKQSLVLIHTDSLRKILFFVGIIISIGLTVVYYFFYQYRFTHIIINKNWVACLLVLLIYTSLIDSKYKWYLKHLILWALVLFLATLGARYSFLLSITILPFFLLQKRWIFWGLIFIFMANINYFPAAKKLTHSIKEFKTEGPSSLINNYKNGYLYGTSVLNKNSKAPTHNTIIEIYKSKNILSYILFAFSIALAFQYRKKQIGLLLIWMCYFLTLTSPFYFFTAVCTTLLQTGPSQKYSNQG